METEIVGIAEWPDNVNGSDTHLPKVYSRLYNQD